MTLAVNIVISIISSIIPILSTQYFLTKRKTLLKKCSEVRENLFKLVDLDVESKLVKTKKSIEEKIEEKNPETFGQLIKAFLDILEGSFKEMQRRRAQIMMYCNLYDSIDNITLRKFDEVDRYAWNALLASIATVIMFLSYVFAPIIFPEMATPAALYGFIAFIASAYFFLKFIQQHMDLTYNLNFLENITDLDMLREFLDL